MPDSRWRSPRREVGGGGPPIVVDPVVGRAVSRVAGPVVGIVAPVLLVVVIVFVILVAARIAGVIDEARRPPAVSDETEMRARSSARPRGLTFGPDFFTLSAIQWFGAIPVRRPCVDDG
jgi:hypothetical protein